MGEDGFVGTRDYPPIADDFVILQDATRRWPLNVKYAQFVTRTPYRLRREATFTGLRFRVMLLSYRDLSATRPEAPVSG